jgi:hypothetical protein
MLNWRLHVCLPFGSHFERKCQIAFQNIANTATLEQLEKRKLCLGPRERFKLKVVWKCQREYTLEKQTQCTVHGSDDEPEATPQMRQNRTHNHPHNHPGALGALQLEIGCASCTELVLACSQTVRVS